MISVASASTIPLLQSGKPGLSNLTASEFAMLRVVSWQDKSVIARFDLRNGKFFSNVTGSVMIIGVTEEE